MKAWMSDGFPRPPLPEDSPSMCMYDMGPEDWNLFCEHCGYSATAIESEIAADGLAAKHLLDAHGIDVTSA